MLFSVHGCVYFLAGCSESLYGTSYHAAGMQPFDESQGMIADDLSVIAKRFKYIEGFRRKRNDVDVRSKDPVDANRSDLLA